jgi:hypothetical protein
MFVIWSCGRDLTTPNHGLIWAVALQLDFWRTAAWEIKSPLLM